MTEIEEVFIEHRPLFCEKCDGKMRYDGDGEYICQKCGEKQLDDFGKIKKYLEVHPGRNVVEVARDTGVEVEIVGMFLKDGRISIPDGSSLYICCERCGCALRHGRYCQDCVWEIAHQIKGALYEHVGEKPTKSSEDNETPAKMRYYKKR